MQPVLHAVRRSITRRSGSHTTASMHFLRPMQGGAVDELLDVGVERPALDELGVEVGRALEDRLGSVLTLITGKMVTWTRSRARRPSASGSSTGSRGERNGTSDPP